jgi:hypothetical protein
MRRLASLALAVLILVPSATLAGAPLKGVDVKLGRNPGGTVASRTTDDQGNFSFGVVPRGDYVITVAPPEGSAGAAAAAEVHVTGASSGAVSATLSLAAASARLAGSPPPAGLLFTSDGTTPIAGTVTAADAVPAPAIPTPHPASG